VRRVRADHYERENRLPDIQVVRYERDGDRSLTLRHLVHRGRPLHEEETAEVLRHLGRLWGFSVRLESVSAEGRVDRTDEWRP
jgi:stage V sporulation protein R